MKITSSLLVFFALAIGSTSYAGEEKPPPTNGVILEFRPSYFYPISSDFRKAFRDGGVNYQLTGTIPVYKGPNPWVQGINIWTAVDYFDKKTHSTALGDKLNIRIVPITLGSKYFFPSLGQTVPINFYLAAGMKYYFVHTYNNSSYARNTINKNGLGGIVETGFIATIYHHLILDLFGSYSFKSFGAPSVSDTAIKGIGLNVSSINIGVGLGYKF
ncbi:MAG: hypothetical protein JSS09_00065 [Verrucomicrobia bacterium]|nr:hypothetical protein [Verrucomicrobiota bacterium]